MAAGILQKFRFSFKKKDVRTLISEEIKIIAHFLVLKTYIPISIISVVLH